MSVTIEIDKYRTNPSARDWDLPQWGHVLSQGVMPLFMNVGRRLLPVGTAFTIGSGVTFILSAAHNVREVFKHEQRLGHLLVAQSLPEAISLKEVSFWLLYPNLTTGSEIPSSLKLLPLETFNGAPPTDVILGFPKFESGLRTLAMPLGLGLPTHGERLWSFGYSDIQPQDGIDIDRIEAGLIDWTRDYSHRFRVVEGFVEFVFTQRFAAGYVEGPCFAIDAELFHGQSGGPTISETGIVRGINSAVASNFFGSPKSIISLAYPLLMTNVSSGINLAPTFRINSEQPLINWIGGGYIESEGIESLSIRPVDGGFAVGGSIPKGQDRFVFDDFSGFQAGKHATRGTEKVYRLRPLKR